MRPIRLELEGFTCFKKRTEIDFENLDLFAITGPTGSGKTSLLDAVIFALYGRTPRLGERQASDLISQGLLRLSVLLEFRASGRRWRIARTLRHTARATLSKPQLEVYEDGEWQARSSSVTQIKGLIEGIVGLDFDGFTKSVVLPQGEFDRFLKGSPRERREILTELLGLHIYEKMGKRAREIAEIARNTAQVKQEQLDRSYADATPKSRRELKKQLGQLKDETEELDDRFQRIRKAQPLAQSLREKQSTLQELEREITAASGKLEEQQKQLRQTQEALEERQAEIAKLEEQLEDSGFDEERFLRLTQLESKAEEWGRLMERQSSRGEELKGLEKQRGELEEQRVQAEKALKESAKALQEARKEEESRQEEADRAVERHGSVEAVGQTLEGARQLANLRRELDKRRQQLEKARQRRSETAESLNSAQKELSRVEETLKEASQEYERLRRLHSAEDLRRHLEKGQPCPVCLQEVPRLPEEAEHQALEEAEQARRQARQDERQLRERVSALRSENQSLPREIETLEQSVEDSRRTLEDVEEKVKETLGELPAGDPRAALKELLQKLRYLREKADHAALRRTEKEKDKAARSQAAQQAVHRLELAAKEAASMEAQQSEDSLRQKVLRRDFREWLGEDDSLQTFSNQLKAQQTARRLSRELAEKLSALQEKRQDLTAQAQRLQDRLRSEKERLEDVKKSFKLQEESRQQVEEELKEALRELFDELPLFQASQEPERDQDDPARQLELERKKVEGRLIELRSQAARGEERLEQLQKRIEAARELRGEIKQEKENASVAKELGLALRANQLISFIQEEAFRRLAQDGTRHLLELSSQRYSFEVESDHFAVLDHWNADEARPVNTLSGGESFLASLSLALALAEGLTDFVSDRQELSLDSLFLDEGFSTLDQETLDVVVQSVETLAGGERLIGVISHVPELAERFPSRIVVSKSIAGSSIEVE
ncbi:MAG TPA: SMC family ATPase [Acidobacteriota bacterium]|nr:SMC family ATPase [Acidobacteriota bacterium]